MELTLEQARTIIDHALEAGHAAGCKPLTVVVLDAGGHLKAMAREDGSAILRPQIASGKAWGALGVGMGSRALARRAEQGLLDATFVNAIAAASGGRLVAVPGGVLVRDPDGALLGAVGISGDTSGRDEAAAAAGIEAAGLIPETG